MTRTAALILIAVLVLVTGLLFTRGCHGPAPDVPMDTSAAAPTSAETRATVSADRGAAAAAALLGQADAKDEEIARLELSLDASHGRERSALIALALERTRTDSVVTTRTVRDTVRIADAASAETPAFDAGLPDLLATRIVVERAAADRALAACATRADTAEALAAVQQSRATWAYAAADSALAALSYTRLAYAEADSRAARSTRLASRRGRLLTVGAGLLVGACAVAILR